MENLGSLNFAWIHGYSGQALFYIDDGTMCYKCGQHVKFVKDDGTRTVFEFPGKGTGPFAVHRLNKKMAFAEDCLHPRIFVYDYPSFNEFTVLRDGAKIVFQKVEFSNANYLLSLSGVPDYKLTLWDFETATAVTSLTWSAEVCTSLAFNPLSCRQICITTTETVTLLHVEQTKSGFILRPRKVRLREEEQQPNDSMEQSCNEHTINKTQSVTEKYQVTPVPSAVAGCSDESYDFYCHLDTSDRKVSPIAQAWSPQGDIFISGTEGHLLKVNYETGKVNMLFFAYLLDSHSSSESRLHPSRLEYSDDLEDSNRLGYLAFHQLGLFAVGEGTIVLLFDVSKDKAEVAKSFRVPSPVTFLTFSYDYLQLAMGAPQGSIFKVDLKNLSAPLSTVTSSYFGEIVGVGMLTVSSHVCVTVRDNGMLQAWSIKNGVVLSSFCLEELATCLACSPLVDFVTVGTREGHVYFIDFTETRDPRLIHRAYLYTGPVKALAFDEHGLYLCTGGDNGNVFVLNGRPSSVFEPFGYTEISGNVEKITTVNDKFNVTVAVISTKPVLKQLPKTHVVCFEIAHSLFYGITNESRKIYKNTTTREFLNSVIRKVTYDLDMIPRSIALMKDGQLFAVCAISGQINCFLLPEDQPLPKENEVVSLQLQKSLPGCQLPGGEVVMSPHGQWLLSYGPDGVIKFQFVKNLDGGATEVNPFSHNEGGVRYVLVLDDCSFILAAGAGGLLCAYKWTWSSITPKLDEERLDAENYVAYRAASQQTILEDEDSALVGMDNWQHPVKPNVSASVLEKERKELIAQMKKEAFEEETIFVSPPPSPKPVSTWLESKKFEVFVDEQKKYADQKRKIRESLLALRRKVITLKGINDELSEVERLDHSEFYLDMDQSAQWQVEEEALLDSLHLNETFKNMVKNALRDNIKTECWDNMLVKGRSVKAFDSEMSVANFPLRAQTKEFLNQLQTVTIRRKLELRDKAVRSQNLNEKDLLYLSLSGSVDDQDDETDQDEHYNHPSLFGGLGPSYGGQNSMFSSQFELQSRHHKIWQTVLIQDAIYRMKQTFNKEFDELYQRKENEVAQIQEKNKRIMQILKSLERTDTDTVKHPTFSIYEKPERLFVVRDDEIKSEKYLTEAEKHKLEEQQREAEERERLERKENTRQRALDMMMGGVLEILREDLLKQDVPIPAFMDEEKDNWTEKEHELAKEYHRKVVELKKEREKFKKQLESELEKLQTWITSCMKNFDETLTEFYKKKIRVTMAIQQEELKILRLRRSLLTEEELLTTEKGQLEKLERLTKLKGESLQLVADGMEQLDNYRNDVEVVMAEDKLTDKSFRREFYDVPPNVVEQLFRHFKKRPKVVKPKQPDVVLANGKSPNPFHEALTRQAMESPAYQEALLAELDSHIPEGSDPTLWQRLCVVRQLKIESENKIKHMTQVMAEMQESLHARQAEDEALMDEITQLKAQLTQLKEDQSRYTINLEVQLLMKQGQIETSLTDFIPTFRSCLLVRRSVVDKFNTNIRQLGAEKIERMQDSKRHGRGIILLEWDLKKNTMHMEDLQEKLKDINFMKVTREVQVYLSESNYAAKKARDIAALEQTIALQRRQHNDAMSKEERSLAGLEKCIAQRAQNVEDKIPIMTELNVFSNECQHIHQVIARHCTKDIARERNYEHVVLRRKLVDQARCQAQEIAALRAEVHRLRQRTVASFMRRP